MILSFDFQSLGNSILDKFISPIPGIILAIVILTLGLVISKWIANFIQKLLCKLGIDKLSEKLNDVEFISKSNVNIQISKLVRSVVFFFVLLIFVGIATEVLDIPIFSNLVSDAINLIPKIIVAIVLLLIGILFSDLIRKVVLTALKSLGVPSANIISMLLFYFLLINFSLSALKQAQIDTDILSQNISILIGGVVLAFAIGYGLASKSVISNYFASFYSEQKLKKGDVITIDDVKGKVIDIDKNSISLETEDAKVIFPLSRISTSTIKIHF